MGDIFAADRHSERSGIEPRTAAGRALFRTQAIRQPLADRVAFGLIHAAFEIFEHTFKWFFPMESFALHTEIKYKILFAAAFKNKLLFCS